MKSIKVHRINFFEPKPEAIRCISVDSIRKQLAVSRSNSSIEIWNVSEKPFLETVIPETNSVETLIWCKGRLFSAGLRGFLVEYDLKNPLCQYQLCITSGCPVWCLGADTSQNVIAAGNEDGHVVLYELSQDGVDFVRKFSKQEGSILCLAWHKDGKYLVTGSIDAIRLWNVESGHAMNRIILARISKNEPTVVWCIAITQDMTIISGDSCGKTSFWDGETGTLVTSYSSQEEMVLSIHLTEEENAVYSSGVDPTITCYEKIPDKNNWMKSVQRRVHTHDVRALQIAGDFLVSGGDDCNLMFTKYPPKTEVKFFPYCQKSYAVLSPAASSILLQYPHYVEVWHLPTSKEDSPTPKNLLRIKPTEPEIILCSSISPNGKWLSYSTAIKNRLFSIKLDTNSPSMDKVSLDCLPDKSKSAKNILFTSEPTRLILHTIDRIFIVKCDALSPEIESVIKEEEDIFGAKVVSFADVRLMELSPDDSYLAFSATNGSVLVYDLHSLEIHCKLPHYKSQATALKFNPSSTTLIVAYGDRKVMEFSLQSMTYTSFSKQDVINKLQSVSYHPITSICFISSKVYFQDESAIYVLDLHKKLEPEPKRFKDSEKTSCNNTGDFITVKKYEHISSIHSLNDELVVVENSSNRVLDFLPPPVFKKRYGT